MSFYILLHEVHIFHPRTPLTTTHKKHIQSPHPIPRGRGRLPQQNSRSQRPRIAVARQTVQVVALPLQGQHLHLPKHERSNILPDCAQLRPLPDHSQGRGVACLAELAVFRLSQLLRV